MQSSTDKVLHWNVSENCLLNSSLPYPTSIPLSFPTCSLREVSPAPSIPQGTIISNHPSSVQDQDKTCHVIHHVAVIHPYGIDLPLLHPHSSMRGPGHQHAPLNHHLLEGPHIPFHAQQGLPPVLWCKVPDVKDWISHLLSRPMEGDQTSSRSSQSQHQDSPTCPLGSNLWTSWPPAQWCWGWPAQGRWLPVFSWLLCFK